MYSFRSDQFASTTMSPKHKHVKQFPQTWIYLFRTVENVYSSSVISCLENKKVRNRPALEEIQSDIEEIQLETRPLGIEFEKPIQLSQNIFEKWTVNKHTTSSVGMIFKQAALPMA